MWKFQKSVTSKSKIAHENVIFVDSDIEFQLKGH
jgi:hypothetical protein